MINILYYLMILLISFMICFITLKIILFKRNLSPEDREEIKEINGDKHFISCGGIGIITSTFLTFLLFNINKINNKILVILFSLSYFFILGLIDDLIKIKEKNSKGLSVILRIIFEAIGVVAITYIYNINFFKFISFSNIHIYIYLGVFTFLYVFLCIVGFINAYNFTDGIDGLATSLLLISLFPFLFFAIMSNDEIIITFIFSLIGSLFAFLTFNFPPSKIIMGDCGSLPLGASLSLIGLLLKKEYLLLIAGAIFVFELLSVIIQVSYFKITKGKRVFKMAPIHYHFIKKGMNSNNVVLLFIIIGLLLSFITIIIGVNI